jgi:hypothetical protein
MLTNEQLFFRFEAVEKQQARSSTGATNIKGEHMKSSVELKLTAAVAVVLVASMGGAMAQGRGKGQSDGPNHFAPSNNSGVNTHMSHPADNNSLFGRTNAEQNKQSFSDEHVTSSGREQREERHDSRQQREERHDAREQREERHDGREQREERHDAREQRQDRQQAHRQREERYQKKSTKEKNPFDGSILEVKPAEINR